MPQGSWKAEAARSLFADNYQTFLRQRHEFRWLLRQLAAARRKRAQPIEIDPEDAGVVAIDAVRRQAGSSCRCEANRIRQSPVQPKPRAEERVAVFFRVRGTSQRPLRCALYRLDTGLELRLEYEDRRDDIQRLHPFRERDDHAIVTTASQWHMALIAKGFVQM